MYTKYWELDCKPFEIGCNPQFYYPSEAYQSVLLKLRYTIESRHGSAVLRGPTGAGKSMLVTMLRQYQKTSAELGPFVTLGMPQLDAVELLCYLADNLERRIKQECHFTGMLQGRAKQRSSCEQLPFMHAALSTVESFLYRNAQEKRHTVLVVEEAQQITDVNVYPFFKSLLGMQYKGKPILSLLFVVANSSFSVEPQRLFIEDCIETVADLVSLSATETPAYVSFRLTKAGAKREIFTQDAMEMIHFLTGGNPRKINRLCDLALLIGFAENLTELGGEIIDALNNELITVF